MVDYAEPRKVAPFRIVPNAPGGAGVYANTAIDNPDGAEISGEFSTLLLPGIKIRGGTLYAADGAKARAMLLTGSVPMGVDLTRMHVEEELAVQGLAANYLKVGDIGKHLDVSWAKLGTLYLSSSTCSPTLDMRRGVFELLDFGTNYHNKHAKVDGLDLRGTTIKNVSGDFLGGTHKSLMDETTHIPEDFKELLLTMKRIEDTHRG